MRAAILLASVLALAACSKGADARDHGDSASGGATGSRAFEAGDFDKLALRGSHDVIVTVGGAASVRAEGDAEALERLEIKVEDGELVISSKRGKGWFGGSRERSKVTVHVSVPALAGASIEGSGDMRIDKVLGDRFDGAIGGSGDMDIGDLRVQRTDLSIAGSGGITAKGATQSADVSIAGSGDVDISGVTAKTAKISVMGSGDVRAQASDTADVSVMGSGDVTMTGSAKCSVSKMGSGNVQCGG